MIGARFQFLFFSCTYGEVPFRFYNADNPAQPHWTFAQQRLLERTRLPIRRLYQVLIAGAALGLVISIVRQRPLPFLRSGYGSPLLIIACYSTPFLLSAAANRLPHPDSGPRLAVSGSWIRGDGRMGSGGARSLSPARLNSGAAPRLDRDR